MFKHTFYIICAGLLFCIFSLTLNAQQAPVEYGSEVLPRIERLENDLATLQRSVYNDATPKQSLEELGDFAKPLPQAANIGLKLQELEQQMFDLSGRVETVERDIFLIRQKLDAILHNEKSSHDSIEKKKDAASTANANRSSDAEKQSTIHNLNDDEAVNEAYNQYYALLLQAEYAQAEIGFKDFISKYPHHNLTSNAYYWLGEAYFVQKEYKKAAEQFLGGYKKFPKGNKAADNLLKLGITMKSLEKKQEACAVFDRLRREIPEIPGYIKRGLEKEENALQC